MQMDPQNPSRPKPSYIFHATISHKTNKVIKIFDHSIDFFPHCLKIIHTDKDTNQYFLIKNQLQRIRAYQNRANRLCSSLQFINKINIRQFDIDLEKIDEEIEIGKIKKTIIQIVTPFIIEPTLDKFYVDQTPLAPYHQKIYFKTFQNYQIDVNTLKGYRMFKDDSNKIKNFISQILRLMMAGGGIDYFFYTPQNVFIRAPKNNKEIISKKTVIEQQIILYLNGTSLVGNQMILNPASNISVQDFKQIYPCIPYQLFTTNRKRLSKQQLRKIDIKIKMRCFGWLLLTFILKVIPVMYKQRQNQTKLTPVRVKQQIDQSKRKMTNLLNNQKIKKKLIRANQVFMGNIYQLIIDILANNCESVSWTHIHNVLIKQPILNRAKHEERIRREYTKTYVRESEVLSQIVLRQIWSQQKNKQFYEERGFDANSPFYFMVKLNLKFNTLLMYINMIDFLCQSQFQQSVKEIHMYLYIFYEEMKLKNDQNKQNQNKIKQKQEGKTLLKRNSVHDQYKYKQQHQNKYKLQLFNQIIKSPNLQIPDTILQQLNIFQILQLKLIYSKKQQKNQLRPQDLQRGFIYQMSILVESKNQKNKDFDNHRDEQEQSILIPSYDIKHVIRELW